MLGAEPSLSARLGGILHTPKGQLVPARTGFWHLSVERDGPGDFDEKIARLLSALSQDLGVWAELARRFRVELFCGMMMKQGNEGVGLSAATILAMAERGLSFELDVYGPQDDEADPVDV